MRLVSSVFALAVLGCCFGPSVDAPPAAPVAPSPLSQALQGMGTDDAAVAMPPSQAPALLPASPPPPPAASQPASIDGPAPACADAQAGREGVRAELRELRLTLGGESTARLEAAAVAMAACNRDADCLRDVPARAARYEAHERAKNAQAAEINRLAHAEVGLYEADQRVILACGAP